MGDTEQQPIKAKSGTLSVSPFQDPVNIVELRANNLLGFYGYVRSYDDGRPKRHSGFDYKNKIGDGVYPVREGEIVQIRFGPAEPPKKYYEYNEKGENESKNNFVCPLVKKKIGHNDSNNEEGDESICNTCGKQYYKYINKDGELTGAIRDGCFGVQLWLKLDNNKYAFYAHLSIDDLPLELGDASNYNNANGTYLFEQNNYINDLGKHIGKTGNTGNASGGESHLHFEGRNGVETKVDGKDTRFSPNDIVVTKFYVENGPQRLNEVKIDDVLGKEKWIELYYKPWLTKVKALKHNFLITIGCKSVTEEYEKRWNKYKGEEYVKFEEETTKSDSVKGVWKSRLFEFRKNKIVKD